MNTGETKGQWFVATGSSLKRTKVKNQPEKRREAVKQIEGLKVLTILLLAATSASRSQIYLLALISHPTESPVSVLYRIIMGGFPQNLSFFIPLSSLLFLSTVLASIVGVIYVLVLRR